MADSINSGFSWEVSLVTTNSNIILRKIKLTGETLKHLEQKI